MGKLHKRPCPHAPKARGPDEPNKITYPKWVYLKNPLSRYYNYVPFVYIILRILRKEQYFL